MEWGWQVSFPCVGWLCVIVQDSSVEFPNSPGWGRLEVNPPFTQAACIGSGLQDMGGDADLCMVWEASPPASPLPPPSSGCLCQSSALGRNQNSSHRATEMSGWSRQSWAKLLLCVPCAVARRCGPSLSVIRARPGEAVIKSAAELSPLLARHLQPLTWASLGKALLLGKSPGLSLCCWELHLSHSILHSMREDVPTLPWQEGDTETTRKSFGMSWSILAGS